MKSFDFIHRNIHRAKFHVPDGASSMTMTLHTSTLQRLAKIALTVREHKVDISLLSLFTFNIRLNSKRFLIFQLS